MAGARHNNTDTLQGASWLLSALAMATFEAARLPHVSSLAWTAADALFPLTASLLVRWRMQRAPSPWDSAKGTLFILAMMAAPFLAEFVLRPTFGIGHSPELVQLSSMRNLMLALAALPRWPALLRLSCVLSLFLALGAITLVHSLAGYAAAAAYGLCGVWWLIGAYWERLQGKFPAQGHRRLPLGAGIGSVTGIGALLLVSFVILGGLTSSPAIGGWFWGSGGSRFQDDHANRGIGDGDAVVASFNNPQSFGPVDDGLMLESHMPSLYDMFNDQYGEPLRPKAQGRSIALAGQPSQAAEHHLGRTQSSGKQFATVRKQQAGSNRKLANIDSAALLYVVGRVPLHLRLETLDTFDGRIWTQSPDEPPTTPIAHIQAGLRPRLSIVQLSEKPWLRLALPIPFTAAADVEPHVLKIVNLKTARIPTATHLAGVHIDQVDRLDFFAWTTDDVLLMPERDRIPPLTVIHTRCELTDPQRLSNLQVRCGPSLRPRLLQQPSDPEAADQIGAIARQWTKGVPAGWPQVEAIAQHLQSEFKLDRTIVIPPDSDNSVLTFLTKTRRGPDYLFASSAVLLLRSRGYPARLATGVYASPANFERTSRLTKVTPVDTHVWAEVCIEGCHWVTVEPSPGYASLQPRLTLSQSALAFTENLWLSIYHQPVTTAIIFAISAACIWYWRWLVVLGITLVWRGGMLLRPQRSLPITLWLMDWRLRLARLSRPDWMTPRAWLNRVLGHRSPVQEYPLTKFLSECDRWLYGKADFSGSDRVREMRALCTDVISNFRWQDLREIRLTFPLQALKP
jgi:protein-glutamine gamma-glutamyltransferase